jgi:hypothetical protein
MKKNIEREKGREREKKIKKKNRGREITEVKERLAFLVSGWVTWVIAYC